VARGQWLYQRAGQDDVAAVTYGRLERSSHPRAAHRRKATAIDSDQWFAQLMRGRHERIAADSAPNLKPEGPFSPGEVEYWLKTFGEREENAGDDRT
jgi:hypothetical protein